MKTYQVMLLMLGVAAIVSGCTSLSYAPYVGGQVVQGSGGTVQTVDGMEIWTNGTPPRKFQIMGIIESDSDYTAQESTWQKAIVREVRKRGGEAAVVLGAQDYQAGSVGSFSAYSFYSVPVSATRSKVAVIKFIQQ